jgi:hypothetical protein
VCFIAFLFILGNNITLVLINLPLPKINKYKQLICHEASLTIGLSTIKIILNKEDVV